MRLLLVAVLAVCIPAAANAQNAAAPPLAIESAVPDASNGTLTVSGSGFEVQSPFESEP